MFQKVAFPLSAFSQWLGLLTSKEKTTVRESAASMLGARVLTLVLVGSHYCFLLHVLAQNTHPDEVSALKSIKESLIDPMKHLKNWNKGDPCASNWTAILCFPTAKADGYLHVREIQLLNMNLSGSLSPALGQLSHLEILDFMWNQLTGSIPKEIGNIYSLKLLLLNGNKLSGYLPAELGSLPSLNRFQIDENNITGPIPKSYGNLISLQHIHFNNNSISGQIPGELSQIPGLLHLLLDYNNLSGYLPPEFSNLTKLHILQLDYNNFSGAEIPDTYGKLSKLTKVSLRHCSLGGTLPDLSQVVDLMYIDLSWNQLTGSIPWDKLSDHITTIDLSNNHLNGSIPDSFSDLPLLQLLSLEDNKLSGSIPASLWENKSFNATARLKVDLRNNLFSNITGDLTPPQNVTLRLGGNPVCNRTSMWNVGQFCGYEDGETDRTRNLTMACPTAACPVDQYFEYVPGAPECFCAAPVRIGYRLKSPSIHYFPPYILSFKQYVTASLQLDLYQLLIDSYIWEDGPRLRMYLKFFPAFSHNMSTLNESEVQRLSRNFTSWDISDSDIFGPYELLNITLLGPYESVDLRGKGGGISKGVLAAIVLGAIVSAVILTAAVTHFIMRRSSRYQRMLLLPKHLSSKSYIKVDGVREFTFKEMTIATDNFNSSAQVGRGGYGKVYKGILSDNTVVAIKRAEVGSLQGRREFMTEIQLLSRLHHRNLVSLVGYCVEAGEQMLVYEFMPNGTLRDWLSDKCQKNLQFSMRLRLALGSAKGILYLHTEANPPIFHRDVKASNILLDSTLTAKVADFGLSRLAPVLDAEGNVPPHVSTVVKGTPGYLDPEYFLTHKLTDKSDVYSLGVVFLELLTGMHAISHGKNLVREVNMAQQGGAILSIIDSRIDTSSTPCVERFVDLALRCCLDQPEKRPSMLDVVRELENMLEMVPESISMSEPTSLYSGSMPSPSSEAYTTRFTHISSDISRSDLTTEIIHPITPR